ncbi:MAG: ATP synthase F1 subunit epsilon [Coriobacteriia bacterium]|jgi:F-type H+-transporting ATPase subunit epsilon|nr:ATP synthase F1 subunit epsilon [Coriobacteriia bacterium]
MARTLLCEIVTPEKIVYTNEVEMVIAPTLDGEVGILPLHAPLVTVLRPGELRVRYNDGKDVEWFAVAGGYLQVHQDKVIVLADAAEHASRVDVERARQAKELAEQRMAEMKQKPLMEREDMTECEEDLKWCDIQLQVAEKRS